MTNTEQKHVKVAMITGYLGAGKTTLLNHILGNSEGLRCAVIVNDIGEVNIDADLIAKTGSLAQTEESLIPMTNGCICCSLSDDLAEQLRNIANSGNFDYIIIEASGICEPMPIAYTIQAFCENGEEGDAPMSLDNVIAVVDAARMFDEFNGGEDLLADDLEEEDIESLLIAQIEFCSTLVLNKTDQVTPDQVAELKALIRGLQRKAVIIEASRGNVPLKELLDTGRFNFEKVFDSAAWVEELDGKSEEEGHENCDHAHGYCEHDHEHDHDEHDHEGHEHCDHEHGYCEHDHDHEDHDHGHHHHHHDHDHEGGHDHLAEFGISTFVYERRAPFTREGLNQVAETWPDCVVRCKGMLWHAEDHDTCYLFEQAGKRFYISDSGPWYASADEEDRQYILEANPHALDDWDEEIGDRRTKLVFIGRHMDEAKVTAWLDSYIGDE